MTLIILTFLASEGFVPRGINTCCFDRYDVRHMVWPTMILLSESDYHKRYISRPRKLTMMTIYGKLLKFLFCLYNRLKARVELCPNHGRFRRMLRKYEKKKKKEARFNLNSSRVYEPDSYKWSTREGGGVIVKANPRVAGVHTEATTRCVSHIQVIEAGVYSRTSREHR